jgi:hypothetical protein
VGNTKKEQRRFERVTRKVFFSDTKYKNKNWDILSFNNFGKSPILWIEQSRALHHAAKLVMREVKPTHRVMIEAPIALLLGQPSVETLDKGVFGGLAWRDVMPSDSGSVHAMGAVLGIFVGSLCRQKT